MTLPTEDTRVLYPSGTVDTQATSMREVISLMVGREIASGAKPVGVSSELWSYEVAGGSASKG